MANRFKVERDQTKVKQNERKKEMNYWLECWSKKYAVFTGRARRKEYWTFYLFNVLIGMAIGFVMGLFLSAGSARIVSNLFGLAALLPGLAVGARRLHDIGKCGWWMLIALIPIVGPILLIVFFCRDSQPGDNAYGANPKGR